MIKQKRGYSLGVLVITIAVMLILTTTALLSFKSMSKDKEITNFMNDLQEVEEYVKEYYGTKRILPVEYDDSQNPLVISEIDYQRMSSQADESDFGNYYYVDLDKLERIHLKDEDRGYIVNKNSLRIYVIEPINYQGTDYYTVTDEMKGYDKTYNERVDFEIIVSGNPITWATKAKLILSIPNLTSGISGDEFIADGWTFKYYENGPITAEEFKDKGNLFLYGETVEVAKNGIVTFYAENKEGYAKTINVVVSQIDDVSPTIELSGDRAIEGELIIQDNETGINPDKLVYKIIGYDSIDNEEGGRPLLTYGIKYKEYIDEYNRLVANLEDTKTMIEELKILGSGDDELSDLYATQNNLEADIEALNDENMDFNNGTLPYSDEETNIVVFAEDYAGNKTSYKAGISRNILLNSSLIDYEAELLDNSAFSVVKTSAYTSGDTVNLRTRSQGASKMLITTDSSISPNDIGNYIPYVTSNGDYEFDISAESGPELVIYAYYTAGETDENGNLVYVALSDTVLIDRESPTNDAPEVEVSNKFELSITVKQEDEESGITNIKYGYQLATDSEDISKYTWYNSVSDIEKNLKANQKYYIRTSVTDNAGNGPVVSEYATLICPTEKIIATPNKPKIGDMQAITWKSNLEEVEIDSSSFEDANGITRVWYDYVLGDGTEDAGEAKWANAKSSDGSYWVWIPRYAYKIIYYTDSSKSEIKGYYKHSAYTDTVGYFLADGETVATEDEVKTLYGSIDIVFLYNAEDDRYYETETQLVKSLIEGGTKAYSEYIVHPAFSAYSSSTTINSNGEWNRELTGIWVAKFEASRADATFTDVGTSNTIKSVPTVKSLSDISINQAYEYAYQIDTDMNSHLMKNSEWGAVAYLAYSDYGRNGEEVRQNLASNMITGAGTTTNGATYATTSEDIFEIRYGYKTSAGMQASTTKNIYGVYDLVGGAAEYVSAYINNGETELATNGSMLQETSRKFMAQSYSEGTTDTNAGNYAVNSEIYGDAIAEISTTESRIWESDNMTYPEGSSPFFVRGGSYSSEYGKTGIFDVNKGSGAADDEIGFRPVLAP